MKYNIRFENVYKSGSCSRKSMNVKALLGRQSNAIYLHSNGVGTVPALIEKVVRTFSVISYTPLYPLYTPIPTTRCYTVDPKEEREECHIPSCPERRKGCVTGLCMEFGGYSRYGVLRADIDRRFGTGCEMFLGTGYSDIMNKYTYPKHLLKGCEWQSYALVGWRLVSGLCDVQGH